MSLIRRLVMVGAALLGALCATAQATVIFSDSMVLGSADPVQLGRLFRGGLAQDWTGGELYPGVANAATPYHYKALTLDLDALEAGYTYGQYLQISIDSTVATTFLSAYLDTYNPADLAQNWLGDAGSSGNAFGVNPLYFQVIVGITHDLVLVFNETTSDGSGLNQPAGILVEAFMDTEYTDLQPIGNAPEPASVLLAALALAALALARRRSQVRKA